MPIAVFPHAHFEALLAALGNPVRRESLQLQPVIVPSLPFADFLQRSIADRYGLAMGLDLMMPQEFIHRAIGPGDGSPWLKTNLLWQVLPEVDRCASHLGVSSLSVRERFALASVIADRIDQYGHFRPEMLLQWHRERGRSFTPDPEAEAWQRDLWLRLCEGLSEPHPAMRLEELRANSLRRQQLAAAYPRLIVLTTGTLDPLLTELLRLLGTDDSSEVLVHVLLPSHSYLGELQRSDQLPEVASDPEDFLVAEGHPLLQSMGRNAVGSFLLLGQLDEHYSNWPDALELWDQAEQSSGAGASILQRLQADIRALRMPEPGTVAPGDLSIRVHACFGPRRELEALRDALLQAFTDLSELRPEQVHIVCSDLETYAPLVAAVFGEGSGRLPVRLTQGLSGARDPLVEGLLQLLRMAVNGRFEASEVLELVQNKAVLAGLQCEDADKLRRWIIASGLTHGVGIEGAGGASFARNRLVAGRWFAAESPARYPGGNEDDAFVLPVGDVLGGDLALRERFADWLMQLEQTVLDWAHTATAATWAPRFEAACRRLLGCGADEILLVQPQLAKLASVDCVEDLDAGALLDWMEAECAAHGHRRRVAGFIPFGRFRQLQNLPCRVLAMVGMHHSAFPAANRSPSWDLLRVQPRIWDRNPRLDDRQQFLDALQAPAERLILTANVRNPRTRKSEPFSTCVDELLRVLAVMGAKECVVGHRLQPFMADYFMGASRLPRSFDGIYAKVATAIASAEPRLPAPLVSISKGDRDASERCDEDGGALPDFVRIEELEAFWKGPAESFVRRMGILLPREEPVDTDYNRPPFELDALAAWKLKQAVVCTASPGSEDAEYIRSRIMADRGLPPGQLGRRQWAATSKQAGALAEAIQSLLGQTVTPQFNVADGCVLAGDLVLSKDGGCLLEWRVGSFKTPKHFLGPWIRSLFAACCDMALPTMLLDDAHFDGEWRLPAADPASAAERLAVLLQGFVLGGARPLCYGSSTSETLIKSLRQDPSEEALDGHMDTIAEAWSAEGFGFIPAGEGATDAAALAWRDLDPFILREEWVRLAETVAAPLLDWRTSK